MPLNIQILFSALDSLVANQAQFVFNSRCLPALPTSFIDSVNVRNISHSVHRDAVEFTVGADVLFVTQDDLDASLDGEDPDPLIQSATLNLRLTADTKTLSLTCTNITLSDPRLQEAADQLAQTLGILGSFDLSTLFAALGTPPPNLTVFDTTEGSLFVRFDPTNEALVNHLFLGMDWCCFIDASSMETLAADFVTRAAAPSLVSKGISPNPATATWAPKGPGPSGLIPHVRAGITGRGHKACLWYTAEATFNIDFSVQDLILLGPSLVKYITWNLSILVDETLGILFWAQDQANGEAVQAMRGFDPTTISGGSRMGASGTEFGDHNFKVANNFPKLAFGSASLRFNNCMAFEEGMALGGAVDQGIPPSPFGTHFTTTKFPHEFTHYLSCKSDSRASTSVSAASTSSNVGRICAVDIITPHPDRVDISPYLYISPPLETTTDSVTISFTLPAIVAFQVFTNEQPVVVRARTTRGVRMIDFGRPPLPEWDDKGNVKNAEIVLLENCAKVIDVGSVVRWKIPYAILAKRWLVDPPPIWTDRIEDVAAFESSLVTVRVRSGQSVIFNQPRDGGMSVVSAAGKADVVTVPVLLAVRSFDEGASLETMNRRDIGLMTSTSKLFRRVAVLDRKGSISHELIGTRTTARVVTTFVDRVETTEIDDLELCRVVTVEHRQNGSGKEGAEEVMKKPQDPPTTKKTPAIQGCIAIHPVPGFEDHSTSIAEFEDGSYRVLSRSDNGELNVTGMVPRWLKIPRVAGGWAISSRSKDRIAVFSVMQSDPRICSCKCQCGAEAPHVAR